jgi:uncharacterized membrane protein YeaQ/YmgE (transglycosylase-associated protein family)
VSTIELKRNCRPAKLELPGFARRSERYRIARGLREEGEVDLASSNLIVTLIIGGVVGWLASILMKTNAQMGIVANIIVGVVGSFVGVFVANALGVRVHTTPASWVVAILGAALLIALLRSLGVFNRVAQIR